MTGDIPRGQKAKALTSYELMRATIKGNYMTNIARELTRARHDNYVQCCEGSKKLEAIAVAFRNSDSATLGRLLTAFSEYRHSRDNSSSQSPLFNFWVWGGLSHSQEDALAVSLHREEVLMGIAFLACECFLVSKQEGK